VCVFGGGGGGRYKGYRETCIRVKTQLRDAQIMASTAQHASVVDHIASSRIAGVDKA